MFKHINETIFPPNDIFSINEFLIKSNSGTNTNFWNFCIYLAFQFQILIKLFKHNSWNNRTKWTIALFYLLLISDTTMTFTYQNVCTNVALCSEYISFCFLRLCVIGSDILYQKRQHDKTKWLMGAVSQLVKQLTSGLIANIKMCVFIWMVMEVIAICSWSFDVLKMVS